MSIQRRILVLLVLLAFLSSCEALTAGNTPPLPPRPLPSTLPIATTTALPAAPPHPSEVISKTDAFLNQMLKAGLFSGSILIARNGEILVSKGYGMADREKQIPNTPQTKFRIGSVTKQFTAMAILILQAQGKLTVQDRICVYLTDCPPTWQSITIHQLLTHTSGIPNITDFPDIQTIKKQPASPTQIIAQFKDKPLDFKPGEKWSYSNSGYIVLGFIIEQVTGGSYEAFLQQHIFVPLKLFDTGYDLSNAQLAKGYADAVSEADTPDRSDPHAAGALYSTVEDLYRWDQTLYTEALVAPDLRTKMFTPFAAIPESFASINEITGFGYGYGWLIGRLFNRQVFFHAGSIEGFRASLYRFPADRVTVIVLSNQGRTDTDAISRQLARIVFGEP
jgi:CubicO group peptidase (beta-lactamase class C family)